MALPPIFFLTMAVMMFGSAIIILCFGDAKEDAFMGKVRRFLTVSVPGVATAAIRALPGGQACMTRTANFADYAINKPNPLLQIFYLLLFFFGFLVFILYGLPLVPNNPRLSPIHMVLPFLAFNANLWTFFKISKTSPGIITPRNVEAMLSLYPYDGFIYTRRTCKTCKMPKVPRSKHCKQTNECVERFDHFCPWVNNAIGARNMRWFLLFVVSNAVFLAYGTYVLGQIVLYIADFEQLWTAVFVHSVTQERTEPGSFSVIFTYLLNRHGLLVFILLLCAVMGTAVFLFFLYQLSLVHAGTTTNENYKWGGVSDYYANQARKRAERGESDLPPDPEGDALLLIPDAPTLEDRVLAQFPKRLPRNIYRLPTFRANLLDALFPPPLPQRGPASAAPVTTTTAAMLTTTTNVVGKEKGNGGENRSGKTKKKSNNNNNNKGKEE